LEEVNAMAGVCKGTTLNTICGPKGVALDRTAFTKS